MWPFFHTLLGAYGSFLYFKSRKAHWLLVAATLLNPPVGLMGLLGGAASLSCRRLLALPNQVADLDVVNGVLLGLMVGTFFAPTPATITLTLLAGLLATLVSRLIYATVALPWGLPILSSPLFIIGVGLYAVGRALVLPGAVPHLPNPVDLFLYQWVASPILAWLISMGQIYFSPSPSGGVLIGLAILLSSRRLFLMIILAFIVVTGELRMLGVLPYTIPLSLAGTAAMLTALMAGGVFARPVGRTFLVTIVGAAVVGFVSLGTYNIFYYLGLPPLSLAFITTTWLLMTALGPWAGETWGRYWISPPQIPETVAEVMAMAEARGVSEGSVGLRPPFLGTWQVYQGWDGPHTHQGLWRHGLDFHKIQGGSAHHGDGRQLTDYHCFGAAICSPVTGTVSACRDDLPDNPPGQIDSEHCWGNFLLIALTDGHHVLLSHIQQGSLTIGVNAFVVVGQILARCGNSGRSPQPHIHLHVQQGPWLGNPTRPFHLANVIVVQGGENHLMLDHIPQEQESLQHPSPNPLLALSLRRDVGRTFTYAMQDLPAQLTVKVDIDLAGTLWLVSDKNAKIAFVQTDTLIALHGRQGGADPSLDALLLTTALTPLCEEAISWRDTIPIHWLPAPWWLRIVHWCFPGILKGESRYTRQWQPMRLCWVQDVHHRVITWGGHIVWSCHGSAELSESLGWTRFRLHTAKRTLQGELVRHGMQADHGISGWETGVGETT
ncbi:MAG: urea transporter [Magnetococcales bacterium]|nr:urea transporter [Magnetococcales bacterium]